MMECAKMGHAIRNVVLESHTQHVEKVDDGSRENFDVFVACLFSSLPIVFLC